MPKNISKSLREYMSKIKNPQRSQLIQLPSKKWILTGCKHPRTPSIDLDSLNKIKSTHHANNNNNNIKDDEAMLADIDRFLFENFKSLFFEDLKEITNNNCKDEKSPTLPIRFDSLRRFEEYSSSLDTESTTEAGSSSVTSSTDSDGTQERAVPSDCVVVLANSASPTEDFRRSMESVLEAKLKNCENVDWDFMAELLFCHMNLNDKKSQKFILSAFVDVVSAMRRPPETSPTRPNPRSVRTIRFEKEVRKKTKEVTLEFGS